MLDARVDTNGPADLPSDGPVIAAFQAGHTAFAALCEASGLGHDEFSRRMMRLQNTGRVVNIGGADYALKTRNGNEV